MKYSRSNVCQLILVFFSPLEDEEAALLLEQLETTVFFHLCRIL